MKYDNYEIGLELGKESLPEGDNSKFTYSRSPGKQRLEHDSPLQTDLMSTSDLEDTGLNIPQYQGSSGLSPPKTVRKNRDGDSLCRMVDLLLISAFV